jgi:hypothetical protein
MLAAKPMQTEYPDLHAAKQQMRTILGEAVARGRSKPKLEVCGLPKLTISIPLDIYTAGLCSSDLTLAAGERCQASWRGSHPAAQRQLCN